MSRTNINGYLDREVEKIRIISFFNRNLEFRIRTMNMSVIFHDDNDARAFRALYDADNRETYCSNVEVRVTRPDSLLERMRLERHHRSLIDLYRKNW